MEKKRLKKIIDNAAFLFLVIALGFILINYDLVPKSQASPATATKQVQEKSLGEPEITGPPEFQQEVKEAIAVIKEKAPIHHYFLCKFVTKIETSDNPPNDKFFSWTNSQSPTIYFNPKLYSGHLQHKNDPTRRIGKYAIYSALAHETAHRIQFKHLQLADQREIEAQALAAERDILKQLEVPQDIINRISGNHILNEEWWEN
ncbi:MAG TPA: hypothetical protein GXX59_11280 [Syntrophomonadaceae bacterium]|nr:hypothetical protein [Syntrophomonadaceae bacterium]